MWIFQDNCGSFGKSPLEIVRKRLIANIPIIASRGATTTPAVKLEEQSGFTIPGFVRDWKMNIYTGTERIRNEDSATNDYWLQYS